MKRGDIFFNIYAVVTILFLVYAAFCIGLDLYTNYHEIKNVNNVLTVEYKKQVYILVPAIVKVEEK